MIRQTAEYLSGKRLSDPRLDAELLLADVLGLKRLDLYLQYDRPLSPPELAAFRDAVRRRARHEPLQYIARRSDFRSLRLYVDERVLIPRPETEVLVGEVLRWSELHGPRSVLDLGTGSGAIALSLAMEGTFERVVASDISSGALEVAGENLRLVDPPVPVELRVGDLFEAVADDRFDVIVSNPPYIGERERGDLDPQVRDWEPHRALFSGERGLDLIERLVAEAPRHLAMGGLLALEIGAEQAEPVVEEIRRVGAFSEPRVLPDLAGRDRIVFAERI